jgi:hypothetical protein
MVPPPAGAPAVPPARPADVLQKLDRAEAAKRPASDVAPDTTPTPATVLQELDTDVDMSGLTLDRHGLGLFGTRPPLRSDEKEPELSVVGSMQQGEPYSGEAWGAQYSEYEDARRAWERKHLGDVRPLLLKDSTKKPWTQPTVPERDEEIDTDPVKIKPEPKIKTEPVVIGPGPPDGGDDEPGFQKDRHHPQEAAKKRVTFSDRSRDQGRGYGAPVINTTVAGGAPASSSAAGGSAGAGSGGARPAAPAGPSLRDIAEVVKGVVGDKKKGRTAAAKGITQAKKRYTDRRKVKLGELRALKARRVREFNAKTKNMPKEQRNKARREFKAKANAQYSEIAKKFPAARGLKDTGTIRALLQKLESVRI